MAVGVALVLVGVLAPAALAESTTIVAEQDTFVSEGNTDLSHGSDSSFDVYGGISDYGCGSGRSIGLLRFDLSGIPAGATVTSASLTLTSFTGFAYNGDPFHRAIFLEDDGWTDSTTWLSRPPDGLVPTTPGEDFLLNGVPLTTSPDNLGAANALAASGCAGTTGTDRTFSSANLASRIESELVADPDQKLSLEIFGIACGTPFTVICQNNGEPTGQLEKAYFLRYHSLEGDSGALLAPRLAVTYDPPTGSISGSLAQTGGNHILSGSQDWAIWGYASTDPSETAAALTPDDRKAGGSGISDLADINPPPTVPLRAIGQFGPGENPFSFSWADGAETPTAGPVHAGLQHNGQAGGILTTGHGFSFTVPADTTTRTLRIYVTAHSAVGSLTATLSDGSTEPYSDSSLNAPANGANIPGVYTIQYAAGSANQTLTVQWVESAANFGGFFVDNVAVSAVELDGPPIEGPPPLVTGLTLAGPTSVNAGAGVVPLAGIPPFALIVPQSSGTEAAPVNQLPVNQSPVNQLPVNQLPVNQSPVNQSPVNQLPVNQSPVNQLGLGPDFRSLSLAPGPLGDTTLATIPLLLDGGWGTFLAGTSVAALPLQSVTLRQVFGLNPLPLRLQAGATNPLRFADIDFSRSLFGSVPAMTLALGQLPLNSIPGVEWCLLFAGPPLNCTGTLPATTSLLSAALAGAPVNQSPVNQSPVNQLLINALATAQAPVNQLPVNQLPVNQLPVNQLPVNQSRILSFPVNQLPVNQSPVNQSPVNQLSLSAILTANAPVNQSPVNQLPVNQLPVNQLVLDCSGAPCTGVLGNYVGKVLPGVTLGDLRRALAPGDVPDDWTLANLEAYGSLIVGDLLKSLPQPNDLTLADVLALALFANNPESFAFETLNILDTSLSLYASPVGAVPYSAAFTLAPNGGPSGVERPVQVSVTLPRTFAFVPGTSSLVQGADGCGSGVSVDDPVLTEVSGGIVKASWTVTGTVGSQHRLCFSGAAGIILGPQSATVSATPAGGSTVNATAPEPVAVTDGGESGGNTPATASPLSTSNLRLAYLTSAADVDYYAIPMPAAVGTRVTFHLSHLPADYDLVVYGPEQTEMRPAVSSTPPLDGAPLVDSGPELTHVTDSLPSQALDDLRLQKLPIVGVSASRGTDPEDVTVLTDGSGGSYMVQVTSYNGATSAEPYMLRVTTEEPRVPVSTPARPAVTGTTGSATGALPTGFNTLFVVNSQRLKSLYPGAGAGSGAALLTTLEAQQAAFQSRGFPNVVLSVDAYAPVRAAYAAWDQAPGDPDLANRIVKAINGAVDTIRAQPNGAGLKYLVIVGGDRVIPQARLGDFTVTANENGYADTFGRTSDLYATLRAGQVLSDDPYGTLEPVPYLNRQLYVPRLAVGRLVETPTEIAATLTRFGSFNGRLDPSTSLTTGYDFMKDGANAINAPFASRFGAGAKSLISDQWTKSLLVAGFLPAAGAPAITSLNGHADHFEFAPPSTAPPYLTSADLPLGPTGTPPGTTGALVNRLVFSMGCHAGLSVSDAVVTANTYDWAQAYSRNGVGAYLGNTGYGYGDSLVVAYSEQLDAIFARKLAAGSTVGNALIAAKQEYFASLGVFGVYDEKAMAEFTLYGLPMWSVTQPGGTLAPLDLETSGAAGGSGPQALALAPASSAVVVDSATGLEAESFVLAGIPNTENVTPLGRYWSGPDGVQATHYRPLQPKAFVEVSGTNGHGALITELHQAADLAEVNPVFARPIVDDQDTEPELAFGDVAFPSRLQALRTFRRDGVLAQRVVLMTGQFFTDSEPGASGQGVQRLYDRIGARVLRSTSADYVPPAFTRIEATRVVAQGGAATAAFAVDVTDLTHTGAAGQVKRVLVALRSGTSTTWTFSDLGQVGTSSRWSGGIPLPTGADFEYFLQAVDAAGNVGVSSNKGFFFAAAAPVVPSGAITVQPDGTPPASGWFPNSTGVLVTGPDGVELEASVDGGAFAAVPPQPTISGDGVHLVEARGSNGGSASTLVPIDDTAPAIKIGTPAPGPSFAPGGTADFTCSDAGSGVASCVGAIVSGPSGVGPIASGAALPTAPGTYALKVTSSDVAGHTSTATSSYTVVSLLGTTAFSRQGRIWVVPTAGGQARPLTQTALDLPGQWVDEQPVVSPDGRTITFARRSSSAAAKLQIWLIDAAGRNARALGVAASDGTDTAPAWSSDGARIAFQSSRSTAKGIDVFVVNASGTGSATNLSNATGDDKTPAWSPDGAKIAFVATRDKSQNEIYVMNANGSGQARLTNDPKDDRDPSYSTAAVGKIAFSSNRTGDFEIYVMGAANGNSQVRITNRAGVDSEPLWISSTRILFVQPGGLFTVAPTAGAPVSGLLTGAAPGDAGPG